MKKILVFSMLTLFLFTGRAWSQIGDAAAWTGSSASELAEDFGFGAVDIVKLTAGALWFVGEVVIFPFRIFTVETTTTE